MLFSYWQQAANYFRSRYLKNGRTRAIEVLEAEDNLALVATLDLLMELMSVEDHLNSEHIEEAWSVLDRLGLLPTAESDISPKVKQFHSLDTVLQESFSTVLLGAMKALSQLHARLKSSMHSLASQTSVSAVQQRLKEIRARARLLVTFSGLLQLGDAGDTNAQVARMEAHMM